MTRTAALPVRTTRRAVAAATAAFALALLAHAGLGAAHGTAASGSLNKAPLASGSLNHNAGSGSLN